MHAMSSDTLSKDEACKRMNDFIRANLSNKKMFRKLGIGLHAVMDSTSPAHEGFQKWHGVMEDGKKHGPWPSSLENLAVAQKEFHTKRTLDAMNRAMSGDIGACGCQ